MCTLAKLFWADFCVFFAVLADWAWKVFHFPPA